MSITLEQSHKIQLTPRQQNHTERKQKIKYNEQDVNIIMN